MKTLAILVTWSTDLTAIVLDSGAIDAKPSELLIADGLDIDEVIDIIHDGNESEALPAGLEATMLTDSKYSSFDNTVELSMKEHPDITEVLLMGVTSAYATAPSDIANIYQHELLEFASY